VETGTFLIYQTLYFYAMLSFKALTQFMILGWEGVILPAPPFMLGGSFTPDLSGIPHFHSFLPFSNYAEHFFDHAKCFSVYAE
jgi:hypothetical protein